jgi:hypothetical protein
MWATATQHHHHLRISQVVVSIVWHNFNCGVAR